MPAFFRRWLLSVCVLFVPAVVYGQASITGVVRDTSGAVLPGVTVEAASPALIEKVRSVISDGTGQYRRLISGRASTASPSRCLASPSSNAKGSS